MHGRIAMVMVGLAAGRAAGQALAATDAPRVMPVPRPSAVPREGTLDLRRPGASAGAPDEGSVPGLAPDDGPVLSSATASGLGAQARWSVTGTTSVHAAAFGDGSGTVAVSQRVHDQRDGLADVTTLVRASTAGPEGVGSGLEARLAIGRSIGRVRAVASASVGQGLAGRSDVDFELASGASVALSPRVSVGLEARARGELVDELKTSADIGRPVEVTAGSTVTVRNDVAMVQAVAGWSAPRGLIPPGPLVMAVAGLWF
jgi:hypothetical protein